MKADLKISYRIQKQRYSQELGVEITNLLNSKNIFGDQFNKKTGKAEYTYQVGIMAIPQWRIIF